MSVYHVTSFDHLTVDTGHSTMQTRDGIGPGVTDAMKRGALAGRMAMKGLLFVSRPAAGGWVFTIGADGSPKEKPMVMCHLSAPGGGPSVWDSVRADREARGLWWPSGIGMPQSASWLSISFLPGLLSLSGIRYMSMLGDAERCFAWTLLDHGQQPNTFTTAA